MKTVVRSGVISLPAARLGGENPLPLFRDKNHDLPVRAGASFPKDKIPTFGKETAFRILPYKRQDRYGRERSLAEMPSVILENDFLKADFLPFLGGRLWALYDKKNQRDIVYRNPVFQPANLAIRDAWFSGGIEWNIGRLGHNVHTCAPVFSGTYTSPDGTEVFRIWEFERQTRLFWRVDFYLPEDSSVLYVYVNIVNSDNEEKPLYWWTNTAVPETEDVRVFAPTDDVIFIIPTSDGTKLMDGGTLPNLSTLPESDLSYPSHSDYSNEYFFQCDRALINEKSFPWECAVYKDGYTFAEASTAPLIYRKMFCWGSGRGGRRWQDFLSVPGERYLELQAGLAPTQLHTAVIPPYGTIDWVQGFSALQVEGKKVFGLSYRDAMKNVFSEVSTLFSAEKFQRMLQNIRQFSQRLPEQYLSTGSGWGVLECKMRGNMKGEAAPGFVFPLSSISGEQYFWDLLLEGKPIPEADTGSAPSSFMIDSEWKNLLADAEKKFPKNWLVPYYIGVAEYESGNKLSAVDAWKRSVSIAPNAWAYRNLAVVCEAEKDNNAALDYYKQACSIQCNDSAIAEEFVSLLVKENRFEEARPVIDKFTGTSGIENLEGPLLDAAALIAYHYHDEKMLAEIFAKEPARIREGNTTLIDLWIKYEADKLAEKEGKEKSLSVREIKKLIADGVIVPPAEIDFRMFTEKV